MVDAKIRNLAAWSAVACHRFVTVVAGLFEVRCNKAVAGYRTPKYIMTVLFHDN
jgi:hypothetical protein